jgi:hypothetical protein
MYGWGNINHILGESCSGLIKSSGLARNFSFWFWFSLQWFVFVLFTDFSFPLSCMDKHEFLNSCRKIRAFVSIGCVLVKIVELIFFFFYFMKK